MCARDQSEDGLRLLRWTQTCRRKLLGRPGDVVALFSGDFHTPAVSHTTFVDSLYWCALSPPAERAHLDKFDPPPTLDARLIVPWATAATLPSLPFASVARPAWVSFRRCATSCSRSSDHPPVSFSQPIGAEHLPRPPSFTAFIRSSSTTFR